MEIDNLLKIDYKPTSKQLESTIGRLFHVGYVLPHARYFINRLRHLLYRNQKYGLQKVPPSVRADLNL